MTIGPLPDVLVVDLVMGVCALTDYDWFMSQVGLQNCTRLWTLPSLAKISPRGFLFSWWLHKTKVFSLNGRCCSVRETLCTSNCTGNFHQDTGIYMARCTLMFIYVWIYLKLISYKHHLWKKRKRSLEYLTCFTCLHFLLVLLYRSHPTFIFLII